MKSSREVSVVRGVIFYLIGLEQGPVKGEVCVIKFLQKKNKTKQTKKTFRKQGGKYPVFTTQQIGPEPWLLGRRFPGKVQAVSNCSSSPRRGPEGFRDWVGWLVLLSLPCKRCVLVQEVKPSCLGPTLKVQRRNTMLIWICLFAE